MILRILSEGQFEVEDSVVTELNQLDDDLTKAVDADDQQAFESALKAIHDKVIERGTPVADDYLGPSGLVLPDPSSTIEEVRELLTDEGLIPG